MRYEYETGGIFFVCYRMQLHKARGEAIGADLQV
jgi:hypothetical protein